MADPQSTQTGSMPQARIIQLAEVIKQSVAQLQEVLHALDAPSPSFDSEAPLTLPLGASGIRDSIVDATEELRDLVLDPMSLIFKYSGHNNMASMQAISRLQIPEVVPLHGRVSFAHIAGETGLDKMMTQRLLRHAMTMRVFCEPEPGMVAHTKASKWLVGPNTNSWLSAASEVMWPAAVRVVDAAQIWPNSQEPNETAFALANNTSTSIYDMMDTNPEQATRFARAMATFASRPEFRISHVVDNYDWASPIGARVVDIGGSHGHVAMELARRFPGLDVVVQDIGKVTETAKVPQDLEGRVHFMAHDFFAPQPVQADVYYFRWILHNWSDKHCILILKALIPALKPGASIVINEACLPEPGEVALWQERDLRSADLDMAALFNGRERSAGEWRTLLGEADTRFELKEVIQPEESALAILHVTWASGS